MSNLFIYLSLFPSLFIMIILLLLQYYFSFGYQVYKMSGKYVSTKKTKQMNFSFRSQPQFIHGYWCHVLFEHSI